MPTFLGKPPFKPNRQVEVALAKDMDIWIVILKSKSKQVSCLATINHFMWTGVGGCICALLW